MPYKHDRRRRKIPFKLSGPFQLNVWLEGENRTSAKPIGRTASIHAAWNRVQQFAFANGYKVVKRPNLTRARRSVELGDVFWVLSKPGRLGVGFACAYIELKHLGSVRFPTAPWNEGRSQEARERAAARVG